MNGPNLTQEQFDRFMERYNNSPQADMSWDELVEGGYVWSTLCEDFSDWWRKMLAKINKNRGRDMKLTTAEVFELYHINSLGFIGGFCMNKSDIKPVLLTLEDKGLVAIELNKKEISGKVSLTRLGQILVDRVTTICTLEFNLKDNTITYITDVKYDTRI